MMSKLQMFALGVFWVGGWGFLFFEYPELMCRIFRVKNPTPKRLRFARVMGAVELGIVFTGAVLTFVWGFFERT